MTPSSVCHKLASSEKCQAKSIEKGEKRKKGKIYKVYVTVKDDEEMKLDEVVKEMKSKCTKASIVSKDKPSNEVKARKKMKLDADRPSVARKMGKHIKA